MRSVRSLGPLVLVALSGSWVAACSDDQDTDGSGGAPIQTIEFTAGGSRPVIVRATLEGDPPPPAPLVVLLHGYGATGVLEDSYLEISTAAISRGFVFAAPDGTHDALGRGFWNATEACCNFDGSDVDDSAYLSGLIDEISSQVSIDESRIYFVGHSNGGFMSHRMACEHADRIAAIVSLAGMTFLDPSRCAPSEPISVLQIHGTMDDTIFYGGGDNIGTSPYPSAEETIARWVSLDGCDAAPIATESMDLEFNLEGEETTATRYGGCGAGTEVEFWSIDGGGHVPIFYDAIGGHIVDYLLAHPKSPG